MENMKGILEICCGDNLDCELSIGIFPYDYSITICTDLTDSFENLVANTDALDEFIDMQIQLLADEGKDEDIEFYNQCKERKLELLQGAEYITFNGFDLEDIAKYIEDNPIIKDKKIVFNASLDLETLNEIEKYFENMTSSICFRIKGNVDFINFKEYSETVKAINAMVKEIDQFDYSPLEKIMHAYDLVRDRVYTKEKENDNPCSSRSLTPVLLGDKIVCIGYSIVFSTLLAQLGIKSNIVFLLQEDKANGHARVEIYVKDEKYGVDGVYYFDPTWDSKNTVDDISYLSKYMFFAKTKESMDHFDSNRTDKLTATAFPYFANDIVEQVARIIKEKGIESLPKPLVDSVNHMSILVYGRNLIDMRMLSPIVPLAYRLTEDKLMKDLKPLINYFNRPLTADILLLVLYNVRKNQSYINPCKYQFGLDEFFKIALLSGWDFEGTNEEKESLRKSTTRQKIEIKKKQMIRYVLDTDFFKKVKQVELAKVLRKVYENKKNNDGTIEK